jgi:hypothetical protein
MKLDPGMHIGLHLVSFGKLGVTLSDSRFALGSSRVCNKLAARARAVDSAMRTDKESCIAALMKKHSGGCISLCEAAFD